VICVLLIIIVPTTVILTASTTIVASSAELTATTSTSAPTNSPYVTTRSSLTGSTMAHTTTSFETTTVSIVEEITVCEAVNELLERGICFLDERYPLQHCNKDDNGISLNMTSFNNIIECYQLQGKCVKSIYMDC
jgi:hypothetical protein